MKLDFKINIKCLIVTGVSNNWNHLAQSDLNYPWIVNMIYYVQSTKYPVHNVVFRAADYKLSYV